MAFWGGVASLVVSAVSVGEQRKQGRRAEHQEQVRVNAEKDVQRAQSRQAEIEAQRARVSQLREERIRRARILATTGIVGQESSGVQGAIDSISSQTASNIGFINQTQSLSQQATAASQRAADASSSIFSAQARGQRWQNINTIFGATRSDFTSIFNKIKS